MKIGIDFGGVISNSDFGDNDHKSEINVPDVIETIKQLKIDGHDLYLISYCGIERAKITRNIIEKSELAKYFTQQYFVTDRKYKKYICEFLGCHVMIDDKLSILNDVLEHCPKIITIHFGTSTSLPTHKATEKWTDVYKILSEIKMPDIKQNKNMKIKEFIHNFHAHAK